MADASYVPLGPSVVLLGDPTVALGAGMHNLGNVEEAAFNAGIRRAFTSTARLAGVPTAEGQYAHAPQPEVQVQLTEAGVDQLAALILNHTLTAAEAPITTSTLGFGDTFAKIDRADVPTLCILPVTQIADGVDAANAIWLPGVAIEGLDGLTWGRVAEGEILNPFNVRFTAVKCDADQNDVAIPAGNRIGFMGPPGNLGSLAWSLPSSL